MWPKGKSQKGASTGRRKAAAAQPTAPEPGRPPVTVSGLEYGLRGAFHSKILGPGIQPSLARVLVEAANHSLKLYKFLHTNLSYIKVQEC